MKFFFFIVLSSCMFLSCKHRHEAIQDPLYEEVMFIHDNVMPKMSTMHHYKKLLKALKEKHPSANENILLTIGILEKADVGMMDWMAEFKIPQNKNEIKSYLESEKTKIQKVSDDMHHSMELAKVLVDSLNNVQ